MRPLAQLRPQHIANYVANHAHELSAPNSYLGGWLDGKNFYLDVSTHRPTLDRAAHDAAMNNQLAIYNLGNGTSINTPDAVQQAGDPGLAVRMPPRNPLTSAKYSPEEQQARLQKWLDSLPDHDYTQHSLGDAEHWGEEDPPEVHQARLAALNPDGTFDMNGLKSTGEELGTHGAQVYNNKTNGENWLLKPTPPGSEFLADLDVGANQIAHMSGVDTPPTFKTTSQNGQPASSQLMYPGAKDAFPGGAVNPDKVSDDDLVTIQKHHALDWMLGNHDSHVGQFIRDQSGKLVGIDKGQAFKYANNDKLHWNFHPNGAIYNEKEPIYNTFYRNMAKGGRMMNDPRQGEVAKYIQGLQDIPDDHYREILRPYAEGAAKSGLLGTDSSQKYSYPGWVPAKFKPNDVEGFLDHVVARKNSLMNDMGDLHDRAMAHRTTGTKIAMVGNVDEEGESLPPDPMTLKSLNRQMGTHGAKLMADPGGTKWLVKPPPTGAEFMVPLDHATAALQSKVDLEGPETHTIPWHDQHASAVKMIPGAQQAFGHPPRLGDLSPDDVNTLQKHQALDWLVSNHDGHVGNFMRTPQGSLVGIDKGQAFKYAGRDRLDPTFHPNFYAREPIYNQLWRDFSQGQPGEMQDPRAKHSPLGQFIGRLQDIPDSSLKDMFRPYAQQAAHAGLLANVRDSSDGKVDPRRGLGDPTIPPNDPDAFLEALAKRKNSLATDLGGLYDQAFTARKSAPAPESRGKHRRAEPPLFYVRNRPERDFDEDDQNDDDDDDVSEIEQKIAVMEG
jgi:hypothetical protein